MIKCDGYDILFKYCAGQKVNFTVVMENPFLLHILVSLSFFF